MPITIFDTGTHVRWQPFKRPDKFRSGHIVCLIPKEHSLLNYLPPGVDHKRQVTGRKVSSVDRYLVLSDYPPKNAGHYYTPPFWKAKQSFPEV